MDTATLAVRFLILVPAHSAPAASTSIPHGENISSDAGQKYFKLLLLEE